VKSRTRSRNAEDRGLVLTSRTNVIYVGMINTWAMKNSRINAVGYVLEVIAKVPEGDLHVEHDDVLPSYR